MNSVLVDTNCILSFLIERDESQHKKMVKFWNDVADLKYQAMIIPHTISEVVFVLQSIYNLKDVTIKEIITDLSENPGVTILESFSIYAVLEIWPEKVKDYGDAILAQAGKELSIPIATFDKKFISEFNKLGIKIFDFK
ncbi:MAG: PIN domain-containing protein [Leptospira sp.]|nr:PIN domain-containing protein [Leptospira sp.]